MSTNNITENKTVHQYNSYNPFIKEIVEYVNETKRRKVVGSTVQQVVQDSGELKSQKVLVLGDQQVVDSQEYCKIYMGEMKRFFSLSQKTVGLLEYIMDNIKYGADRFCIYYPDVKERIGMVKSTMYTCINQLLDAKILAKASVSGCYYINPAVVFKGERITLVKQFVLNNIPNEYESDIMQEPITEQEIQEHNNEA